MLLFLTFLVIRLQIGKKFICFHYRCINQVPGFPHLQSLVWAFTFSEKNSAALKYRIGVTLYIEERNCPYCQNGRLDRQVGHALSCHGRGIYRGTRKRYKIFAACSTAKLALVSEQKFDFGENLKAMRHHIVAQRVSGTTRSVRCNHNFPTTAQSKFRCAEEVWFCSDKCRNEKWNIYPKMRSNGYPIFTSRVWTFRGPHHTKLLQR